MQNEAKNVEFFIFFKKYLGKDFLLVFYLYTPELYKNAKKRIVISFLSQTLCETAVIEVLVTWFINSYNERGHFIHNWTIASYDLLIKPIQYFSLKL